MYILNRPRSGVTKLAIMSEDGEASNRVAIGISFGNSYSSIAYTSAEGKPEVIANEEGGQ